MEDQFGLSVRLVHLNRIRLMAFPSVLELDFSAFVSLVDRES